MKLYVWIVDKIVWTGVSIVIAIVGVVIGLYLEVALAALLK